MSSEAVFTFGGNLGISWARNSLSRSAPSSPATRTSSAVTRCVYSMVVRGTWLKVTGHLRRPSTRKPIYVIHRTVSNFAHFFLQIIRLCKSIGIYFCAQFNVLNLIVCKCQSETERSIMTSTQPSVISECARLPLKALYVLTFVFLLLFASSASCEAILTVQHTSGVVSNATSVAVPFNSSVTAGNLILVAVSSYDGVSLVAPTDLQSNSFTQLALTTVGTSGNDVEAIYAATASASGADTVTCNLSASNNIHCHIYELQGVTAVVDQTGSIQQASDSLSVSTSAATTNAVDYLIGFFSDNFSAELDMPGTGWADTELTDDSGGDTGFTEDMIVTTTGVQTATATTFIGDYSTPDTYVNLIVALKTSGTATVATPTLSPASGTYGSAVAVTLDDTTLGSTIYYTTDGTRPRQARRSTPAPSRSLQRRRWKLSPRRAVMRKARRLLRRTPWALPGRACPS
jgi:hypothetical protein